MAFDKESMNKIEIIGRVGKVNKVNNKYNFSVYTTYMSKAKDGVILIEDTWFNVLADEDKVKCELEPGHTIHLIGRLRSSKYISSAGDSKISYMIVANEVM